MSVSADITTYTARLASVRTAIDAVLLSQEYWLDGKRVTRADLAQLTALETRYENKLKELESINGGTTRILARRGTA